jgi:hypothetical protein
MNVKVQKFRQMLSRSDALTPLQRMRRAEISVRANETGYMTFAEPDAVQTHFASEQILSKEWSNQTEDEAWKTL